MNELATAPDLLARIRARYRGEDVPEGERDRLVVEAIAAEFGVHPNSIWCWAKRFGWQRPAWYHAKRGRRRTRGWASGPAVGRDLLCVIERLADNGAPCPSNVELARQLNTTTQTVVTQMRGLRASGRIRSEVSGPLRRLVLADGRATRWTRLSARRPGSPFHIAVERPAKVDVDRLLVATLGDLAKRMLPVPGNGELGRAIGRAADSVRSILARLVKAGAFALELRGNDRRIVFPDGRCTPWREQLRRAPFDPAVSDAVRALRRQGLKVYDVAVETGRAWGVAWWIEGRITDRRGLLAAAAERQARAMAALCGAVP